MKRRSFLKALLGLPVVVAGAAVLGKGEQGPNYGPVRVTYDGHDITQYRAPNRRVHYLDFSYNQHRDQVEAVWSDHSDGFVANIPESAEIAGYTFYYRRYQGGIVVIGGST